MPNWIRWLPRRCSSRSSSWRSPIQTRCATIRPRDARSGPGASGRACECCGGNEDRRLKVVSSSKFEEDHGIYELLAQEGFFSGKLVAICDSSNRIERTRTVKRVEAERSLCGSGLGLVPRPADRIVVTYHSFEHTRRFLKIQFDWFKN